MVIRRAARLGSIDRRAYSQAVGAPGFGGRPADAAEGAWPTYGADFLPAAFSAHYIRSGFFTSRPAGKVINTAPPPRSAWTLKPLRRRSVHLIRDYPNTIYEAVS